MKSLDHPNLVAICDIFEDSTTIYLAMKLCKGADGGFWLLPKHFSWFFHCFAMCFPQGLCISMLFSGSHLTLYVERVASLSEKQAAYVMRDLFRAVAYMHHSKDASLSIKGSCKAQVAHRAALRACIWSILELS